MKRLFASLVLVVLSIVVATAQHAHGGAAHQDKSTKAEKASHAAHAVEVVKRGEPIGDSERVKLADVLREPRKYAGKRVVIEGVVNRVCKKEGCWMEISPETAAGTEASGKAVRVTFGNHSFFVPKDSDHTRFRAEGVFSLKTLSREQVEHLVKDDGAKIKVNPDGTADEIAFAATGVELWK